MVQAGKYASVEAFQKDIGAIAAAARSYNTLGRHRNPGQHCFFTCRPHSWPVTLPYAQARIVCDIIYLSALPLVMPRSAPRVSDGRAGRQADGAYASGLGWTSARADNSAQHVTLTITCCAAQPSWTRRLRWKTQQRTNWRCGSMSWTPPRSWRSSCHDRGHGASKGDAKHVKCWT